MVQKSTGASKGHAAVTTGRMSEREGFPKVDSTLYYGSWAQGFIKH